MTNIKTHPGKAPPSKMRPKRVLAPRSERVGNAIVGGVIGAVVAGPVGAATGAIIGSSIEKGPSRRGHTRKHPAPARTSQASKPPNTAVTAEEDEQRIRERLRTNWWWRHESNLWTYDSRTHQTTAKANWRNLREETGEIRMSPFINNGHEQFRSILVLEPWKGPVEHSAYAYELIRRLNRDHWLPGYLDLSLEEQGFLKEAFGSTQDLFAWGPTNGSSNDPAGFTRAAHWNLLEYSDEALIAGFRNWIREERAARGVRERTPIRSELAAEVNWRLPELLDLEYHGRQGGSTSESRLLARAKSLGTFFSARFWHLLKADHRPGLRWPGLPPERQIARPV